MKKIEKCSHIKVVEGLVAVWAFGFVVVCFADEFVAGVVAFGAALGLSACNTRGTPVVSKAFVT
jgi:hypothetical protein